MKPSFDRRSLFSRNRAILLSMAAFWLVIGFDGRLHWDEPQYLYTGAFFSIPEIVAGDFEPSGIEGFTVSRIGHVALVRVLAELFGIGGHLIVILMLLYTALLVISWWVAYLILRDLELPASGAALAALVVAFSPVSLYLAYKTLPDVPALMWSSLAVLAGLRAVRGRGWIWIPIGAVAIAVAVFTKYILVWTFAAFALAVVLPGHVSMPRHRSLPILLAMTASSIVVVASLHIAAGFQLSDFLGFLAVARAQSDPVVAKLFHLLVASGVLLAVLPIAAFNRDKDLTGFFLTWFGIAALPFLIVVPRLETRYLAPGLIPWAGLTFLALDVLRGRLPAALARPRSEAVLAGLLVVTIALSSRSVQALTEHEVEMYSMHRLLGRLDAAFGPGAYAVATPWEYSTFLYLRLAYPDRALYNAFDPRLVGRPEWARAQARYFDGRVLQNLDQLRAIPHPVVYIGFREAMPIANLRDWADLAPDPIREAILDRLDSLPPLQHISLSWMWKSPALSFAPLDQVGNYVAYRVTLRETDGAAAATATKNKKSIRSLKSHSQTR